MGRTKAAGPAATDQLTEAVRVVARLSRIVESTCQAGDLSLPQYRLLTFLATEPQRFRELSDLAAVRPPTLTALVDALEAKGLVSRSPVEGDRRALQVEVTEAGLAALTATESLLCEKLGPAVEASGRGDELTGGLKALGCALDAQFDAWLQSERAR